MNFRFGDCVQIKDINYAQEDWSAPSMSDFIGTIAIVRSVKDSGLYDYPHIGLIPASTGRGVSVDYDVSNFWWAPHSLVKIGNIFESPWLLTDVFSGSYLRFAMIKVVCGVRTLELPHGSTPCVLADDGQFVFVNNRCLGVGNLVGQEQIDESWTAAGFLEMCQTVSDRYHTPFRCICCGNRYDQDPHPEELDMEDTGLCPVCRKREFVLPYHHFTPKLTFWKMPKERTKLYFGAEIEADKGGESKETAKFIVRTMNTEPDKWFMYVSHDGSLNDGIEMVTAPCTLKYHLAQRDKYKALFSDLVRKGYRAHNTSTCGLHIHFSRAYYADNEEENICKLLYLVEKFWDDIVILSRRNYKELSRYYKKVGKDPKQYVGDWNKTESHEGHYYAVNITNPETIELRVFRGTLNVDTYLATMEFVDKLVRTAKNKTAEELQRLRFTDLLTPASRRLYEARRALLNFEDVTVEETVRETDADSSRSDSAEGHF